MCSFNAINFPHSNDVAVSNMFYDVGYSLQQSQIYFITSSETSFSFHEYFRDVLFSFHMFGDLYVILLLTSGLIPLCSENTLYVGLIIFI